MALARHHGAVLLLLAGLSMTGAGLGCGAADERRSVPAATAPALDKAALYGDPTLVPTRAGERARRELSLAQPIDAALRLLPGVMQAQIDVQLPSTPREEPRVLAVVQIEGAAEPTAVERQVQTLARQIVGSPASIETVVIPGPTSSSAPQPRPRPTDPGWPLSLGLLGLGFCVGVLVERARRLRRPRRAPHLSRRPTRNR